MPAHRRRTQASARAAQAASACARDALVTLDAAQRVTAANSAARALFGSAARRGAPLEALLARAGLGASDPAALPRQTLVTLGHPERLFLFECLAAPRGRGFVVRAIEMPAVQGAQRLSGSPVLAFAAHEIRSPLAVIRALVQTMGLHTADVAADAEIAIAEIDRLNLLLEDMLAFDARAQAVGQVDLRAVVGRAVAVCGALVARKEQELVLVLPTGALLVPGRVRSLEQAVLNLLRNACEAAPQGGTVRVEATLLARGVLLEFTDDGPGFTPEARAKLGQPFFTTKDGGTGLGLAICARVAEQHGGRLELGPAAEGGQVRLYLPL